MNDLEIDPRKREIKEDISSDEKIETAITNLEKALELEAKIYLDTHRHLTDTSGRHLVVKNGLSRPRKVLLLNETSVIIRTPRIDDRRKGYRFKSKILPPFLRTFGKLEKVLPFSIYEEISDSNLRSTIESYLGPAARSTRSAAGRRRTDAPAAVARAAEGLWRLPAPSRRLVPPPVGRAAPPPASTRR